MERFRARFRHIYNKDVDAVIRFLPILKRLPKKKVVARWPTMWKNEKGDWVIDTDTEYNPKVESLIGELCEHGFVGSFDWPEWQNYAQRLVRHPELVEKADMRTCIKLLTTHVRKERFCSGHFGEMVEIGHITAILRRLAELRK